MPVTFLRYLPADPDGDPWGVRLSGGGEANIPPGVNYPINPESHPEEYLFTWESGRVLHEHAIVLIASGGGAFESAATGRLSLKAGDVFFLHPGVWHRYRPHSTSGWTEHWVNFGGDYAEVLIRQFFPAEHPVVSLSQPESIVELLRDLHRLMEKGVFSANRGIAIARLLEIIACIRQQSEVRHGSGGTSQRRIQEVCLQLLSHPESVDWGALARQSGMSLSHFRRRFRETIGYSPHQYLTQIRINRAKALLRQTDSTLEVIAEQLGYVDPAHLSKAFRQAVGMSPRTYRNSHKA